MLTALGHILVPSGNGCIFRNSSETTPWHLPMFLKRLFIAFAATILSHLHFSSYTLPKRWQAQDRTPELRQCVCHRALRLDDEENSCHSLSPGQQREPDHVVLTWHHESCYHNKGLSMHCSCPAIQCCHPISQEWLRRNRRSLPFHHRAAQESLCSGSPHLRILSPQSQ